ncbi:MAG: hypothetical protein K9M03_04400 [Kiritimatiellales bacterium]|nr:hypothetical protein [Kiritimatiellales bacterium]
MSTAELRQPDSTEVQDAIPSSEKPEPSDVNKKLEEFSAEFKWATRHQEAGEN